MSSSRPLNDRGSPLSNTDRDDYRNDVGEYYLYYNWKEETGRSDNPNDCPDDEYEKILDDLCAKVDDKWRDCIIVEVDN